MSIKIPMLSIISIHLPGGVLLYCERWWHDANTRSAAVSPPLCDPNPLNTLRHNRGVFVHFFASFTIARPTPLLLIIPQQCASYSFARADNVEYLFQR